MSATHDFAREPVNILLVDDQPAKLMSYEVILGELGENLLKASSAKEALELLLRNEVAVLLVDVCMPDLDGFELAKMIREHPRFQETAIIFISAIHLSELDSLRGYEMGAVDYVPVPVVPGVLRAKVRVFVDLFRKTRELARINDDLERRVAERAAELETALARQELLSREVDHRARNTLAVIQAIVSMTPSSSSAEFARAVDGRIRAMGRAHTLMSETRWTGADLARLVGEELEPFRGEERYSIEGPAVLIRPSVAQNLALAIHELATNAAKYGALSGEGDGKLAVSWQLSDDTLALTWIESSTSPVEAPAQTGFGTKVIRSSVKALDGEIETDWRPAGLLVHVRLPAQHFEAPSSEHHGAPTPAPEEIEMSTSSPVAGRRIFLVEDEPLVAMMMSDLISDLGATPIGPYGRLPEAFEGLSESFDAALLDVNVAGEMVFPLADEIRSLGVPVIFLTGYQVESIASKYGDAPVLTKPIDASELTRVLGDLLTPAGKERHHEPRSSIATAV